MGVSAGMVSLTPQKRRDFLYAIEHGLPITRACMYATIYHGTFLRWREEAEDSRQRGVTNEYTELFDEIAQAEARTMLADVDHIRAAPSWTSRAWFLERRFPQEFGQRQAIEVSGPDGQAIQIQQEVLSKLSTDELLALDSALNKLRGGTSGSNDGQLSAGRTVDSVPLEAWSDPEPAHRNGTTLG